MHFFSTKYVANDDLSEHPGHAISKIPIFIFCRILCPGHIPGLGVSVGRVVGALSIEPFLGEGGEAVEPKGFVDPPPRPGIESPPIPSGKTSDDAPLSAYPTTLGILSPYSCWVFNMTSWHRSYQKIVVALCAGTLYVINPASPIGRTIALAAAGASDTEEQCPAPAQLAVAKDSPTLFCGEVDGHVGAYDMSSAQEVLSGPLGPPSPSWSLTPSAMAYRACHSLWLSGAARRLSNCIDPWTTVFQLVCIPFLFVCILGVRTKLPMYPHISLLPPPPLLYPSISQCTTALSPQCGDNVVTMWEQQQRVVAARAGIGLRHRTENTKKKKWQNNNKKKKKQNHKTTNHRNHKN